MAVIGKIREKSGLLMIVIGVAMLAFLGTDLLKAGQSLFGGGTNLGEIGDVEITAADFNNRLDFEISRWEAQNQQIADGQARDGIKEQVWNELIREELLVKQFVELGITVTAEELDDMITGSDPHPSIKQSFTNPETNLFESGKVLEYLKNLDRVPPEQKEQWLQFEDGIQKERVATKYNNMLVKGMYATSSMIKRAYKEQGENRNIQFVAKRYSEIADSTITVTDADLKAYYDAHKKEYKQDESRDIEFVKFDVIPSDSDRNEAKLWIEEVAEEFKAAESDSAFISYNPEEASYDPTYYGVNDFPANLDSSFFFAEVGTTVGPTEQFGSYVVTKLTDTKMVPDSVKARHILLKYTQTIKDTTLEGKLDSIKAIIENGGDFAAIAKEKSEDVGSAIEGGDLGWFKEGMMVQPFNDACFDGKVGDLAIVQSEFGFHLIEIQEQGDKVKKVQLAKLVKQITASDETFKNAFAKASTFYSENNSSEAFSKAMESDEYNKVTANDVKVGDKTVNGLQDVRELVRWAYNNDKGSISKPEQYENTFVVAHLSEVKEDGIATMDQVSLQVELGAKKKKKAEKFIAEMQGILDLKQLSDKTGSKIETAANVNFAAYSIPGLGQEFSVIGAVSTIPEGKMTATPIEGQTGVFVVLVDKTTPAPETTDYSSTKSTLNSQYAGLSSKVLDALKEMYGVVDQRYKFY
jgi:peptidyl-prolyl cis-trans isomerase D